MARACGGADERVGVLPGARDVGVAEGAAGAAVLIDLGGTVDARSEGKVVVVFGVDGAAVRVVAVERVWRRRSGSVPKLPARRRRSASAGIGSERVVAVLCAFAKEADELALVEWS